MKFKHTFKKVSDGNCLYKCENINAAIDVISSRCINVKIYRDDDTLTKTKNVVKSGFSGELDGVEMKIETENFLLSFYKDGKRLFADRAPLAYNFEHEFGDGVFHYITREEDEKIYGLGDKSGYLNKAGKSFKIETTDSMGYDAESSDPLYKHVPFYICENSVGCYGIFYDTDCTSYIDLGREHNNYYEKYKFFRSDDSVLNYYVFFGSKLEILQEFGKLIGENAFPPKWSFDYCASTMAYTDAPNSYEEMLGFIEKLKEYDLSCRGFYLSSGYTSIGNQRCVFNWNYDKFPNPKEFIETFKKNNIEIIPNIKPSFLVTHPMYDDLKKKGLFIKNPDGTPFVTQLWDNLGSYLDFTNPEAAEFWKKQVTEKLLDLGIVSTWNDNNEFDIKDSEAVSFGGEKAKNIRPHLTYLMDEASFEAQKEKNSALRPFLSTRSGNIGVRRLAQTWSGDNSTSFHDLKFCHFIGLTMSLSGYYFYGHDLGGFYGEMPNRELLMRWLQHGVFEPRFTIHSWNTDGSSTMPWSYPDIIDSVRKVFAQRKRLIPYLYICAYNACKNEIPINSPLFLFYDDEEIDENGNSFMVGRDIIAVTAFDEGQDTVKVYLPKADSWYLGGKLFEGGQELEVSVPTDDEAKFFVKAGSVIPYDEAEYGFNKGEKLVLRVYPKQSGSFESELFFDDGLTDAYIKGVCTKLKITADCNENEIILNVKNEGNLNTDYEIKLVDGDCRSLIVNNL